MTLFCIVWSVALQWSLKHSKHKVLTVVWMCGTVVKWDSFVLKLWLHSRFNCGISSCKVVLYQPLDSAGNVSLTERARPVVLPFLAVLVIHMSCWACTITHHVSDHCVPQNSQKQAWQQWHHFIYLFIYFSHFLSLLQNENKPPPVCLPTMEKLRIKNIFAYLILWVLVFFCC